MVKKRNTRLASKSKTQQNNLAEKAEQILLAMPKMIATRIGKDLIIHKQQENQLKTKLRRLEFEKKNLILKITGLKKKTGVSAKKQINTSQQSLQKMEKLINTLSRDLHAIQKNIFMLTEKKAKYNALQAQLIQFQKVWAKNPGFKINKKTKKQNKPKNNVISLAQNSQQGMMLHSSNFLKSTSIKEPREIALEDMEEKNSQDSIEKAL